MGLRVNPNETDPMERVDIYRLDDALLGVGEDEARKLFAADNERALARILQLPFDEYCLLDQEAIASAKRSSSELVILALAVALYEKHDGAAMADRFGFGRIGLLGAALSRLDAGNWAAFIEVLRLYRPTAPVFDWRQ